jgi:hypothetical protein
VLATAPQIHIISSIPPTPSSNEKENPWSWLMEPIYNIIYKAYKESMPGLHGSNDHQHHPLFNKNIAKKCQKKYFSKRIKQRV